MTDKKIIVWYLIGTFLLTYLMWGVIITANHFGYLKFGTFFYMIIYAAGGLAPTIFGYVISKKANRIEGFIPLVKEYFRVKQPLKYYVLMLGFFAISFGIPALMNGATNRMAWYYGFPLILQMIFFGGLEELGWRYTLQPTLEKHLSFFAASLITAYVWALWHLPLFFIEGMNKGMNFWLFVVGVFGMAFSLAAIYHVSKSIWLCVLFHASINAFSQVWAIPNNIQISLLTTLVRIVLAVIIVALSNHMVKSKKVECTPNI